MKNEKEGRTVVKISIVGTNVDVLLVAKERLCKKHLVAGLSYNECDTTYWQGGALMSHKSSIIRGITFYEKIKDIENVLPEGAIIISACPSTYVNPKTERWLSESIR